MGFLLRSHNRFLRADLGTGAASIAFVLSNQILDQILTYPRRTFLIPDMGEIFFGEIFKGGQQRIGGGPSQGAKGCLLHGIRNFGE